MSILTQKHFWQLEMQDELYLLLLYNEPMMFRLRESK